MTRKKMTEPIGTECTYMPPSTKASSNLLGRREKVSRIDSDAVYSGRVCFHFPKKITGICRPDFQNATSTARHQAFATG